MCEIRQIAFDHSLPVICACFCTQLQFFRRGLGEKTLLIEEALGLRLYTGPLFEKYNAVNRGGSLTGETSSFMELSEFSSRQHGLQFCSHVSLHVLDKI